MDLDLNQHDVYIIMEIFLYFFLSYLFKRDYINTFYNGDIKNKANHL